jgi:hypothetical protein
MLLPWLNCLFIVFLQAGIRYSQADLSSADRRGLLWLLDEEAIFPGATDESFVERLLLQYSQRGSQVCLAFVIGLAHFTTFTFMLLDMFLVGP